MTSTRSPLASLPLALVAFGYLVLFGAIAFVFALVIMSLVTGGPVDFVGGHAAADASGAVVTQLA